MSIIKVANENLRNLPGRIYDHSYNCEAYGLVSSIDFLSQSIDRFPGDLKELDYFMAISWGEEDKRIIDFFGYSGVRENWRSNPEVKNWILHEHFNWLVRSAAVWQVKEDVTCGDGLIVLGKEEQMRRHTISLSEYASLIPDLQEINSLIEA